MKRSIKLIIIILFIIVIICSLFLFVENKNKNSDAVKFSKEYTKVTENNVFIYKNKEEIIKILKHGTGIVYFGFPECPWCQAYVKILNDVAKEEGLKEIYYYNILEDRKNNTDFYKEVVSILNDNLDYDNEGNKRIYVPDITGVYKGKIVGHDNETSMISGDITPEDYWTDEVIEKLQIKLKDIIAIVTDSVCTSCNKD